GAPGHPFDTGRIRMSRDDSEIGAASKRDAWLRVHYPDCQSGTREQAPTNQYRQPARRSRRSDRGFRMPRPVFGLDSACQSAPRKLDGAIAYLETARWSRAKDRG